VDSRSEGICKGRLKMAGDARVPQRGRGVSGIELTGRRHAVFGILAELSLSVPYQAIIGIGGPRCPRQRIRTSLLLVNSGARIICTLEVLVIVLVMLREVLAERRTEICILFTPSLTPLRRRFHHHPP
jgi:hypothetical protein